MFGVIGLIIAYLIGAIPTGYIIARYFFRIDITRHGSGNIGATNIMRVIGGIRYFFIVFLFDAAKAWLCLAIADQLLTIYYPKVQVSNILLLYAAALLLGNVHSVFLRFKGGKGVATTLGVIAYLIPLFLLLLFISTWVLLIALTRHAFIASIGATFVLAVTYAFNYYSPDNLLMYFLFAVLYLIIWRHKSNIIHFIQ